VERDPTQQILAGPHAVPFDAAGNLADVAAPADTRVPVAS
jgi:hypothetical protein